MIDPTAPKTQRTEAPSRPRIANGTAPSRALLVAPVVAVILGGTPGCIRGPTPDSEAPEAAPEAAGCPDANRFARDLPHDALDSIGPALARAFPMAEWPKVWSGRIDEGVARARKTHAEIFERGCLDATDASRWERTQACLADGRSKLALRIEYAAQLAERDPSTLVAAPDWPWRLDQLFIACGQPGVDLPFPTEDELGTKGGEAAAILRRAYAWADLGDFSAARATFETARRLLDAEDGASVLDQPRLQLEAKILDALLALTEMDLPRAEELLAPARSLAEGLDPAAQIDFHFLAGTVASYAGDTLGASRAFEDAGALAAALGPLFALTRADAAARAAEMQLESDPQRALESARIAKQLYDAAPSSDPASREVVERLIAQLDDQSPPPSGRAAALGYGADHPRQDSGLPPKGESATGADATKASKAEGDDARASAANAD